MSAQQREQYWQQMMNKCQASGLSGMAFCKQQSLSYHRFTYWRSKLRHVEQVQPPGQSGFARVAAIDPSGAARELTITLPSGISIVGLDAQNVELLGSILRQL